MNALVEGLVDPRFGVRRVDAREGPAMGKGLRGAEEKMTLDELFARESLVLLLDLRGHAYVANLHV